MRMPRSAALALALVLTTGLAACGDDDDAGGDALEDVDSGDSSTDTTEDSSDGDSSDDGSSDVGDNPFVGAGCQEFAEAFAQANASLGSAIGAGGDIDDVAEFFDQAADDAPDEIQDALRTFGAAYAEFAERLEEAGVDLDDPSSLSDPEVAAVFGEAVQALSTPEVAAASEELTQFTANNCETG